MVLNAPVKEVFNLLYISDSLKEYHEEAQKYDVDVTQWQRDDTSRMSQKVFFKCPLPIRLGPKETRVEEKQIISFTDQEGLIIEVEGRSLDLPYSNYFLVHSFFEMSPMNDGQDTLLVVSVAIDFSKSTMLRGQIESGALLQPKTAFGKLVTLGKERVDEHLLERAATQTSESSTPTTDVKTGVMLEHHKCVGNHNSKAVAHDPERHQRVNRVVGNSTTATSEERKLLSSPGMASAGNRYQNSLNKVQNSTV